MSEPAPTRRKHKTRRPELTAREIRFARLLFAGDKTATACYLEAGFPPGASPNATQVAAHRVVKKPQFRQLLRDLQDCAAQAARVDAAMVTRGLARIAFADRAGLFDGRGRLLLPHQWPADVAGAVEGVESEDLFEYTGDKPRRKELVGYTRKVKTAKRTEALKVLAQILRMVGPDVEAGNSAPAPLVIIAGPEVVPPPPGEPEESDG